MWWQFACSLLLANSIVFGATEINMNYQRAAERFQQSVQIQTFQTVLLAIEDRLTNLDNIYSMQLSETLKTKLDAYHRKLEILDSKIIRLESLVMLNLDKISENISTKNYKDEVSKTQTWRKLENIYDSLSYKINYLDRKFEMGFDKIQNKIEITQQSIDKMEKETVQRSSDLESEISDTLANIEDYKNSAMMTELTIMNLTNMLTASTKNNQILSDLNLTMQNFNNSVHIRLEALENHTLNVLNKSEETHELINSMKGEVKEDFNDYANKVADMNTDIWRRNDLIEKSLKTIEFVANLTRIEVQNDARALMIQCGKSSGKEIVQNDKSELQSFKKSIIESLEKVVTNQDLFLESCHRVQMDESQIESEISVMLGKLIDMLETKMKIVMKDLKTIEKSVKSHDSRISRNMNQANTNIISLFEKTSRTHETLEKEMQDIKFYVNSLFTFIQEISFRTKGFNNTEDLLNDVSLNISNLIKLIDNTNENSAIKWTKLEDLLSRNKLTNKQFIDEMKLEINLLLTDKFKHHKNVTTTLDNTLVEIRTMLKKLQQSLINSTQTEIMSSTSTARTQPTKCKKPYYLNLIDVRTKDVACEEDIEINTSTTESSITTTITAENEAYLVTDANFQKTLQDIFGTPDNQKVTKTKDDQTEDFQELTDPDERKVPYKDDESLQQSILEIFGTPPSPTTTTVKPPETSTLPDWADLINIRYDNGSRQKSNKTEDIHVNLLTSREKDIIENTEEESDLFELNTESSSTEDFRDEENDNM